MNKVNGLLLFITLLVFHATVNARDYRDNIFEKFNTHDFKEYFSNETCYEFQHNEKQQRLGILKNTYQEQKYNNLIESQSHNKQVLYRLIEKKCKNQLLDSRLLEYSKFQMITNIQPKTRLEVVAFQLYCDRKTDKSCPYNISNNMFEAIVHSKEYYIHEIFGYVLGSYFKKTLAPKVAQYLKTGNSTIAFYLLKDAYILYQCKIGKDCSNTSTFMVEKCLIDDEFCGLDIKTYFSKYKHSLSQSKDVQKIVDYFEQY